MNFKPLAGLFLAAVIMPTLASAELSGSARVVDGDTITIAGERIRLDGIDAPEGRQMCQRQDEAWECGKVARDALEEFLSGSPVECQGNNRDRYGRLIARCYVAGVEVNEWLVRHGWALDWPRYSDGRYAEAQFEAQRERRGIWDSKFTPPWEWRQQN
jgi:endonuclease YncB( thermonuclease family)